MKKTILSVAGLSIILAIGCRNDNFTNMQPKAAPVPCDTTGAMSFATNVAPIINTNCAVSGCHVGGASAAGGYDFTTYAGVKSATLHGDALLPAINHSGPNSGSTSWMPLVGSLTSCDIAIINKWANNGVAP